MSEYNRINQNLIKTRNYPDLIKTIQSEFNYNIVSLLFRWKVNGPQILYFH